MIPRTLHYCWFGNKPLPPLSVRCIESWNEHMSDYQIVRWDESNTDMRSKYAQVCARTRKWAFLSDYVRFDVLHRHGGIYMDVDVEVLKPMDALLGKRLFLGWESRDWINASVVGGEAGNPHLRALADLVESEALASRKFVAVPQRITSYLTRLQKEAPEEVALYSPASFYPFHPWDETRPVGQLMVRDITADTFAIHHWQHSWKSKGWRHYIKRAHLRFFGNMRDF